MGILSYFSKKERKIRRLQKLLVPKKKEEFYELTTFGSKNSQRHRVASFQNLLGEIRCMFIIFDKEICKQITPAPTTFTHAQYKKLLKDLHKKFKKGKVEVWEKSLQALQ